MAVSITINPITGEFDLVGSSSGVDSVNGKTGVVTLTKSDIGLGNVDNTSDLNKPISSATQTALNGKFNSPAGTSSQYVAGDGTLISFPTIPSNLDSLSDVTISGPSNGQVLTYDLATTSWKNGGGTGSAGDISETSFSMSNNQSSAASITGFAFSNSVVRSFKALISIEVDATSDLFQTVELLGIQKGSQWDMMQTSTGDNCQVIFSITSAGQIQYISGNISGFVSGKIKFRAITLSV